MNVKIDVLQDTVHSFVIILFHKQTTMLVKVTLLKYAQVVYRFRHLNKTDKYLSWHQLKFDNEIYRGHNDVRLKQLGSNIYSNKWSDSYMNFMETIHTMLTPSALMEF